MPDCTKPFLNQYLFIISEVLWHLLDSNSTASGQATIFCCRFENLTVRITFISPTGQWVKIIPHSSLMTHIFIDLLGQHCLDNGPSLALYKKLNCKECPFNIIWYHIIPCFPRTGLGNGLRSNRRQAFPETMTPSYPTYICIIEPRNVKHAFASNVAIAIFGICVEPWSCTILGQDS